MNPIITQSSRWTSSSAVRDITMLRSSTAMIDPATNVHSAEPNNSCARTAVSVTTSVPASAEVTRQPRGFIPKALIPIAICHLPSGGCTHDPTSHLFVRQYFSSPESMWHTSLDQPTRMHAAFG